MLRLNEEKSRIISDKHFKSVDFKRFCNDNIQMYDSKAKYLIGLESNTFDWLLEMFQYVAQCSNYLKMYKYINVIKKQNKDSTKKISFFIV